MHSSATAVSLIADGHAEPMSAAAKLDWSTGAGSMAAAQW
jgi:hypothetical protein